MPNFQNKQKCTNTTKTTIPQIRYLASEQVVNEAGIGYLRLAYEREAENLAPMPLAVMKTNYT
jgi:hypothetical protein